MDSFLSDAVLLMLHVYSLSTVKYQYKSQISSRPQEYEIGKDREFATPNINPILLTFKICGFLD